MFLTVRNQTCPSCRAQVHSITDDFRATSLLEVYLKLNPTKARSQEEFTVGPSRNTNLFQIVNVDPGSESEDSGIGGEPVYHTPCPTCDPNNYNIYGYVCPFPVPTAPGQQIPQEIQDIQGHRTCLYCRNLGPVRGIEGEICGSCNAYSCFLINPTTCPDSRLCKFKGIIIYYDNLY